MQIQRIMPSLNQFSPQYRIAKAHFALGSSMGDVAMPKTVFVDSEIMYPPYQGALSGLNEPQLAKIGTSLCLAKHGYVKHKSIQNGVMLLTVAVPVYAGAHGAYKSMLFANLIVGLGDQGDPLGNHCVVEVDPKTWHQAVKVGERYRVKELRPAHDDLECNPFDYAQALLPVYLPQPGGEERIDTASLCEFLSEVFRFMLPDDRALFMDIMVQGDRFSKFLHYAASTRSHHHNEHGLLIHTAETVANVLLNAISTPPEQRNSRNPRFDLSLTLLAALLHDAGKVDDYIRLAPSAYLANQNCELLGHEQTMLKWIAVACAVSGHYPKGRELQLQHAICAVKKQHDQSGARKRKTSESFVLHEADCDSARGFDQGETSVLLTHKFTERFTELFDEQFTAQFNPQFNTQFPMGDSA